MRRLEGAREYLDRPLPAAARRATLDDVHRLNHRFGGYRLTLMELDRLGAGEPARPLLVADIGGARGDFAARAVAWGRRRGRPVRVIVVDRDAAVLGDRPDDRAILAVRADATALPFRPGGLDVVTASLTLHHLEPEAAVRGLAEMRAAARLGVIVNDLLRTPVTLLLVWVATRLFTRHPYSRHDGPVSVRRAYAPEEIAALAGRAGLGRPHIRRFPFLGRLVAVLA